MNCNVESETTPAWESSKENVVPIKRGRSAKGLGENLSVGRQFGSVTVPPQETEFEALLKQQKHNSSELLLVYIKYFKWIRDSYPSDTEKTLKLLEVTSTRN